MQVIESSSDRLKLRVILYGALALFGGITLLRWLWDMFNAGQAVGGMVIAWFGKPG